MLGERLKQLRKDKKLTQQEMADKLGITRGTYAHYEIDRREPDNATLTRLADFFGVTIDSLLGRDKKVLAPKNGIITKDDIREAGLTNDEIEIIRVTRKEGLSAEDIQHLAEVIKRHKPKDKSTETEVPQKPQNTKDYIVKFSDYKDTKNKVKQGEDTEDNLNKRTY